MQLRTHKIVVTFQHSDGSFTEASQRSVRIMAAGPHKGALCVERRSRLLAIEPTSGNTASCNLGAEPLASGYAEAQAVAPVASLAALGIAKAPKPAPKSTKSTKAKPAPTMTSLEEAIATVRENLKGKPFAEAQALMTSLLTVDDVAKPKASSKRGK